MAIQYKEVLQEDEDELIQNCKSCEKCKNNKDCKNNFESVKCELLEDEDEEDEVIMWTWSEIGITENACIYSYNLYYYIGNPTDKRV